MKTAKVKMSDEAANMIEVFCKRIYSDDFPTLSQKVTVLIANYITLVEKSESDRMVTFGKEVDVKNGVLIIDLLTEEEKWSQAK